MAIRTLRIDDDPVLRKPCRPIAQVDERIHTLLDPLQYLGQCPELARRTAEKLKKRK